MNDHQALKERSTNDGRGVVQTSPRPLKGGHDPAEMGRRSGKARREKKAERDMQTEHLNRGADIASRATGEILVPIDEEAIYVALRAKAERGDVQAARLILERTRPTRTDVLALLMPEQRAIIRGWLEELRDQAPD